MSIHIAPWQARSTMAQTNQPKYLSARAAQCWAGPWLLILPPASSEIRCEALRHNVAESEFCCVSNYGEPRQWLRRVRVGCAQKKERKSVTKRRVCPLGALARASGSTSTTATSRSLSHPRRRWKHSGCCCLTWLREGRQAMVVAQSWW